MSETVQSFFPNAIEELTFKSGVKGSLRAEVLDLGQFEHARELRVEQLLHPLLLLGIAHRSSHAKAGLEDLLAGLSSNVAIGSDNRHSRAEWNGRVFDVDGAGWRHVGGR